MDDSPKRTGSQTRAAAIDVALTLFGQQGYEATSLRQIAEALGITKAALYYHFASKEEIVTSGFAARGAEAAELLAWANAQPISPELRERVVLRWIDSQSTNKLRGIRFANANAVVLRRLSAESGNEIGDNLEAIVEVIAADEPPERRLLVRMAMLSINSAATAAEGTSTTDEQIISAARDSAIALLARLRD